jgi:hypothetical protein
MSKNGHHKCSTCDIQLLQDKGIDQCFLLPPEAEGDVYDFITFFGSIDSVEIVRYRNFDQSMVL